MLFFRFVSQRPGARAPPAALLISGVNPVRFGMAELLARETALQLGAAGWRTVLCFEREPPDAVRERLAVPATRLETSSGVARHSWKGVRKMLRLLGRYRPRILHLQFTPFLSVYAWLARLSGVEKVFFTDQGSRPEGYVAQRPSLLKRAAARILAAPYDAVVAASDYNCRTLIDTGCVPASRVKRVYNGAGPDRCASRSQGVEFRTRHGIPIDCTLVVQVSWIIPEKGIAGLLAAAKSAARRNPNACFALV